MSVISFLPPLIAISGLYFLIRLRFFPFLHPKLVINEIACELKKPRAFSSLMLALAGTLGVGNIIGVAVGISVGGSGAVFWLLVSSLFSSIIKYCEVALATDKSASGMAEVIKMSFPRRGRTLGKIYTGLCLCLSLTMGTALQSGSIGEIAGLSIGIPSEALLIPLILFLLFFILGGANIIEKGVKYIIPATTALYTLMCLCIIIPNFSGIPSVICSIMASALDFGAGIGGALGFLTSAAMREGFARGMLSNEAGAGTSALAHSRAEERSPFVGGLFGMLEVFFDTVVLCPLTAFAILLSNINLADLSGAEAIIGCFGERIICGDILVFICVLFFALSTVLCWYYYGSFCFTELFGERWKIIFVLLFVGAYAVGLFFSSSALIYASDILLFFMSAITLATLSLNAKRISELTNGFINKKRIPQAEISSYKT